MIRAVSDRVTAVFLLLCLSSLAKSQSLPPDLPLAASPPSQESWLRTAHVLQPDRHSQFLALFNPGDRPQKLKQEFGFNAIIVLPPDAHNAISAPADHLTDEQFRAGVDAYRKAGYKLILYTSVMALGVSPEFQSGDISRKHPDWLQRDPKGNPVMVWGVPWLCPSTGARQAALDRCERLMHDYSPDGLMLDNNEFYFAQAGWTCHCDACTAAFRKYTQERVGVQTCKELFGAAPDELQIPSQEGPLFWFWTQFRDRVWAEVDESFRARLRQINPQIVFFANTQYLFDTAMLAADSQFVREDVVLSESVGLTSRQMSDKLMLGHAMAQGRPLWNYIGTFTNSNDYTGLRPASIIAPMIAATLAHGARPWIVDGFDLGATDASARAEMSRLLGWQARHEELYAGKRWAAVAVLISPTSRDVRHRPLIPPVLSALREAGTPVIALRDDAITPETLRPFQILAIETCDCLSESAAKVIADWAHHGGKVMCADETGAFDSLGRRREIPTLAAALKTLTSSPPKEDAEGFRRSVLEACGAYSFRIDPKTGVEVVPYLNGGTLLIHIVRHDAGRGAISLHVPQVLHPAAVIGEWLSPASDQPIQVRLTASKDGSEVTLNRLKLYGVLKIL